MNPHFPTSAHLREARLLGRLWGINRQQDDAERQRMQQNKEQLQQYFETGGVPNAANQRMNTTGERLGKTRGQMLKELSQQFVYLTRLIDTMRAYFKRDSQSQRNNVRGAMAISPRYGGGMGPLGFERRLEAQGAAGRMQMQFGNLQQLEMQRDQIKFRMAQLYAENQAGLPDYVTDSGTGLQTGTPDIQSPRFLAPGMEVAQGVQLGGGAPFQQERNAAAEVRGRGVEEEKMIDGLPAELQEPVARLYELTPEESRAGLFALAGTLGAESPDVLRKFFTVCFSPEGTLLSEADVKIEEGDADGEKALALLKNMSSEERQAAEGLLAQAKLLGAKDAPKTFAELDESTRTRILKYAKRWNEASDPPDSPDREIAEGMLYLDGVDVEASVKGKTLEEKNIKMLDRTGRIFGLLAGLIKLAHGFKRKFGETARGSDKPEELKKPEEMTAAERAAEITDNNKKIADLKEKQDKTLPTEIARLKQEIDNTKADDTEAITKLKMNLKAAEDELAAIPDRIKKLEERNTALVAAVTESEVPESERFALGKCREKIVDLGSKYGVSLSIVVDKSVDYDRSLVVLEKMEQKLATLDETQLQMLKDAKPAEGGTAAFTMEGVSLMLVSDDEEAKTFAQELFKDILENTESIDADPRVRFAGEKEKFKAAFEKDLEKYMSELSTNPIMQGIANRLGVDITSPDFKAMLRREMPKVKVLLNTFIDATNIEPGADGTYRLTMNLKMISGAAETAFGKKDGEITMGKMMDELTKIFPMKPLEGDAGMIVSEFLPLEELMGTDFVKGLMKPLEEKREIPDEPIA